VSETGRYTRGTGVCTPLDVSASSNPVDMGWMAARTHSLITEWGTSGRVLRARARRPPTSSAT
jgi:hypothetical protein